MVRFEENGPPRFRVREDRYNIHKTGMPKFITEDNKDLLAFRFSGKKPMVEYRYKNIFYVLWFDHKRKLYKHGP
uniref:Uncharacterized protein n=1 Tax=Candidatus Kentrum sp. LPFa TaxID=2126335 RepID=A0A450XD01_9GAMM|nr:MAG: hypothetical protein BECKLPF1236A_GA0070988_100409 [Candidatus Kentron sp. LPFa]VFK27148.1 MAG: hypothetical protein BECKLPF1236C_GA0070990_100439 [Candidatus Kentron sp. LPFa]